MGSREGHDVREQLALAGRMLAREDDESGLAGQITGRAERPGTFWTTRFGHGLDEVTASNLLLVDDDLNPIERTGCRIHRRGPIYGSTGFGRT